MPTVCSIPAAKLPRKPQDEQIVCDVDGNMWQFDAASGSWLNRGVLKYPPGVTEEQDGLVTPDVFARLDYLKSKTNVGKSLPPELKINPHTDAYWYLFTSSDKLIRFSPEGPQQLRIEIDSGRLFTLLVGRSCRGPKGLPGDPGDHGDDAVGGGAEPCFAPTSISSDKTRLDFNLVVQAPLTTDISLRLASSGTAAPDIIILLPPSGDPSKIRLDFVSPSLPLDITRTLGSIAYDPSTQRLTGSFFLATGTWSIFCILARQKGPTGDKGDDGKCIITPLECAVSNTDIKFIAPAVAIRKGCNADQLLMMTANLFSVTCVSKLRLDVAAPGFGSLFSGSGVTGRFMATRKTLEPCKELAVFTPDLPVLGKPELELPEWQPQPDCNVSKRAEESDLNWPPITIQAASNDLWAVPTGSIQPQYPWLIMMAKASDAGDCDPCDELHYIQDPPCPGG